MEKRKRPAARRKPKASTGDVVGSAYQDRRVRPQWRRYYERLIELRDRMLSRQADLASDALQEQPTYSTHMADAGTDTYDRDFALGMLSSEQDAVYQIEQAVDRIRNGTYGKCELTGKPIEPARLEAIPWTRFSAEAERQLEKDGLRRRARLGPRDSVARSGEPENWEAVGPGDKRGAA
jgi:RNA polymerase-binding transcription factor DksA